MDNVEKIEQPINSFTFEGVPYDVVYVETAQPEGVDGVDCDVYKIKGHEKEWDLGIIRIQSGKHTPLQRVKKVEPGDRTVEGYVSGKGKFTITRLDGTNETYTVGGEENQAFSIEVTKGELMQWEADPDSKLVAYEVCFPPYEDGRYENIKEAI